MSAGAARGLTAEELAAACGELSAFVSWTVLDAVALHGTGGNSDLLLVLAPPGGAAQGTKSFVHVALGGARARVATTARRFGKAARQRGPGADVLHAELDGAVLCLVHAPAGERRCTFAFAAAAGERQLHVELFSARGLWALCDEHGVALTLSRPVETAVRTLRRGDTYVPPPAREPANAPAEPPRRFAPPVLEAIDAFFTPLDLEVERSAAEGSLRSAAERAWKKAEQQHRGLSQKLADTARSQELRATADLMLAYAHTVRRGAASMQVPDLDGEGTRTIELDPATPVAAQANRLYDQARRLDDGRATDELRRDEAGQRAAQLASVLQEIDRIAAAAAPDEDALAAVHERLRVLGVAVPKAAGTAPAPEARPSARRPKAPEVPFRRFVSAEGYAIFVGRNNTQNDELTMRFANGNDLWLHVGGGRPGSHVVVRLPKQKTASLETLLDAATLAVHFSKARGERRIDVIYTHKKHVKKPKGLPPGAVVPSQTRTVTVQLDEARLRRVLDSGGDPAD